MITFITSAAHDYTTKALNGVFGAPLPSCHSLAYDDLFSASELPGGTYIFCDIERLSDEELVIAASCHRVMVGAPGFRVLNDPSRVKTRYALLRSLFEAGINDFDAYRADGHPRPRRFPVFVRSESAHDKALTELLPDQTALDDALRRLVQEGHPLRGLLVIEYCAEPVRPGVFRRWGTFQLGAAVHLDHIVSEDNWNVKWGRLGLVDEAVYAEDDAAVRENRHSDILARAFLLGGIDYGRADFGLVGSRPQIYEVNTNPFIGGLRPHPSPTRTATMRFSHERFAAHLRALDTSAAQARVHFAPAKLNARAKRAHAELMERYTHILSNIETASDLPRNKSFRRQQEEKTVSSLREELQAARQALQDHQAAVATGEKLAKDVEKLVRELQRLRRSRSWRVTRPLRVGSGALRALGRRLRRALGA